MFEIRFERIADGIMGAAKATCWHVSNRTQPSASTPAIVPIRTHHRKAVQPQHDFGRARFGKPTDLR